MLKYMEFIVSLIKNLYLFQRELSNCIDTPSAQGKVKSVYTLWIYMKNMTQILTDDNFENPIRKGFRFML